ncbi:hypothetical protein MKW98_029486, partial [Papaver atlanticum]
LEVVIMLVWLKVQVILLQPTALSFSPCRVCRGDSPYMLKAKCVQMLERNPSKLYKKIKVDYLYWEETWSLDQQEALLDIRVTIYSVSGVR